MQYLGKKSVSHYLGIIFTISWYIGLLAVAALTLLTVTSAVGVHGWQFFNRIDFPGLSINLDAPIMLPLTWQLLQLLALSAYLVIIFHLRKIFLELSKENPFHMGNVRSMRLIGIAIILGGVTQSLVASFTGYLLMDSITISGGDLVASFTINPNAILFGLIVMVFAEVLKGAVTIKEENNLTI